MVDNTPGTANDLGFLTSLQTFNDFVGTSDLDDYYRFQLDNTSNFEATLTGGRYGIEIFRDTNNNNVMDDGEILGAATPDGSSTSYGISLSTSISQIDGNYTKTIRLSNPFLNAGDYFLRVYSSGSDTNYDLSLGTEPLESPTGDIIGTPGNDNLVGTVNGDTIYGLEGDDTINGGGGNDTINGQEGNDIIDGGLDNDNIYDDSGNNRISGGLGNDNITSGGGNDTIDGGLGADNINSGDGNDIIRGGLGNDNIIAGGGFDTAQFDGLYSDYQIDIVNGTGSISGPDGFDFIIGIERLEFSDRTIDLIPPPSTGTISGSKWNDADGDGIWDSEEVGLEGWTIYLDQNQNNQLDAGETFTTTDSEGNYSFTDLSPGTYYVAEVLQEGWQQTYPGISPLNSLSPLEIENILNSLTTTGSDVPIYTYGEIIATSDDPNFTPQTNVSGSLINIDDFRADSRFAGIDGSGFTTVIIDTGIDLDHPFFGPDEDGDGISDRIVYQYDFADNDDDASDVDGHGSNVSSIVASSDATFTGMAPGADIIHLKVFNDNGEGNFGYTEEALRWIVDNAADYNIASVNLSLGDSGNWQTPPSGQDLEDRAIDNEIEALAQLGIIVVSASGNDFRSYNSVPGVAYPAADPNSLSVGAVFDENIGGVTYSSGAEVYSTDSDRITPFSQRHETLTTIFAPGAAITGADFDGSTAVMHGTSQAAPHIAGIAALAQQLAVQELGRRLTTAEFSNLLVSTGVTINDGDDEDDNVVNTGLDFQRVDVLALGEAILTMADEEPPGIHVVDLEAGETVEDINFGNIELDSISNWGFETGDFTNWNTLGNATIQTADFGDSPTEGEFQALITTGNDAVNETELESFLGLSSGTLDSLGNGDVVEGSALQLLPITVQAGDVLSFDWNFLTNESNSGSFYRDFALVSIASDLSELADSNGNLFRSSNAFGLETTYGTYNYQFATDGTFTLALAVVDAGDQAVDSGLLVDNVRLDTVQVFGFETGDFTHWDTIGDATVHSNDLGSNPTEGQFQALISTNNNAVSSEEVSSFLGLNPSQLDGFGNGTAIEGSALQLTSIDVEAGDILSFDWNFLTNESTPSNAYNDFGIVSIGNTAFDLVDTNSSFSSFNREFRSQTSYGTFSYEFTEAGTYNIGIGVVDVEDPAVDTALLVDNLTISSNVLEAIANSQSTLTETTLSTEIIPEIANTQLSSTPVNSPESSIVLDLTSSTGQSLPITIPVLESDATFENFVGLYAVENEQGTVIDPLTGQSLNPGETGYTSAAIRQSQLPGQGLSFNTQGLTSAAVSLESSLYAPFIIADGTPEELLDSDSINDPQVYFSFANANPDQQNHIVSLGNNTFGFEDMFGGGDLDFNDMTFSLDHTIA